MGADGCTIGSFLGYIAGNGKPQKHPRGAGGGGEHPLQPLWKLFLTKQFHEKASHRLQKTTLGLWLISLVIIPVNHLQTAIDIYVLPSQSVAQRLCFTFFVSQLNDISLCRLFETSRMCFYLIS